MPLARRVLGTAVLTALAVAAFAAVATAPTPAGGQDQTRTVAYRGNGR